MNKYHNKTVTTPEGKFDSVGEYERWLYLRDQQSRGYISDLRRQVVFPLFPAEKIAVTSVNKQTLKVSRKERSAAPAYSYIADFAYRNLDDTFTVEDFKGVRTAVYNLKRAALYQLTGLLVAEVKAPGEDPGAIRHKALAGGFGMWRVAYWHGHAASPVRHQPQK